MAPKEFLSLCKRASRDVLVDKGFTNAAAIAYYAIVSLFPLPLDSSLVIGTGAYGKLPVMDEAKREAARREIKLLILPTAQAIVT